MNPNRNDYEPIIAERRSREPVREEAQPLWRVVIALVAGLVVVAALAWWWMQRSGSDGTSATAPTDEAAPEVFPEEQVAQETLPSARGLETEPETAQASEPPAPVAESAASAEQSVTPQSAPEVASAPDEAGAPEAASPPEALGVPEVADVPETASDTPAEAPAAPAPLSVRFTSPDAQVRIELRGPLESSPPVTSKAGDVVSIAPGTYRVTASGSRLETLVQEVTFDGERPLEYTVELCAERERQRESLAGQVVDERACGSTAECESMFMILSEHAGELVQDRAFRTQQCAKWRANAAPDGKWTLDIKCGGATLATTCRIEIGEGACIFAEPRRSVRGGECPRAELK